MQYLKSSGENLFQRIKKLVRIYEETHGAGSSINIAVGEPDTAPPEALRSIVAETTAQNDAAIHTYWDNRDPGSFASSLVHFITGINVEDYPHLSTLVLPGEKSMLCLLPFACGGGMKGNPYPNEGFVVTEPAYDMVHIWCEYANLPYWKWTLFADESFRLNLEHFPKTPFPPRLIVTVRPGNPTPVGATKEEWEDLIAFCIKHRIRLVNDGAYSSLVHKDHVTLSEVAVHYPELSWMEFFSISKAFSACGWRLGAAVGSKDFIEELAQIKGNADSGPFGPALVGMERYLQNASQVKKDMAFYQELYQKRLAKALPIFEEKGLKLACPTDAGFFMLFQCPKKVNDIPVENSEHFNQIMIESAGLVGVPFSGKYKDGSPAYFIRYTVCSDFLDPKFEAKVREALKPFTFSY